LKALFLSILLTLTLYAQEISDIKAKIIINIAHVIMPKKTTPIKVYNTNHYFNKIFTTYYALKKVKDYHKADIILTNDSSKFRDYAKMHNVHIISTKYQDYKNNQIIDECAFFWQKGRPNILLNSKLFQRKKIKVPKSFTKYSD